MTERSEPTSTDDGAANLGNEVKLLVDLVVQHSAPWLDGIMASGHGPEFSARALEQAAQLVALLRAVLADRWHPAEGVHLPGFQPEKPATPSRRREPERASGNGSRPGARVQHIAVRTAGETP